jgi:hypothetical protein
LSRLSAGADFRRLQPQRVMASRSLPTQLPRQSRHRIGQRRGHSRPRVSPGKILHPQTASGAFDPTGAVTQFQWQFPHRQIAPFARLAHTVYLPTSPPADSATQQPTRSRSMWTIMNRSVSSTFVTVCAFSPSCFLRNVSISTSILFFPGRQQQPSKNWMDRGFRPPVLPATCRICNPSTSIALLGYEPKNGADDGARIRVCWASTSRYTISATSANLVEMRDVESRLPVCRTTPRELVAVDVREPSA